MEHKPLLIPATEAAAMLGIGKTLLYQMASDGRMGPVPVELGSKRLYRVQELENWVAHLCPPRDSWLAILEKEREVSGVQG